MDHISLYYNIYRRFLERTETTRFEIYPPKRSDLQFGVNSTIHKVRILRKKLLKKTFLSFKNGVKSIQTAGYNGAHMVVNMQGSCDILDQYLWMRRM